MAIALGIVALQVIDGHPQAAGDSLGRVGIEAHFAERTHGANRVGTEGVMQRDGDPWTRLALRQPVGLRWIGLRRDSEGGNQDGVSQVGSLGSGLK